MYEERKKSMKKVYEVKENETISQCLDRIRNDGYMPVKRTEKPIFKEKKEGSEIKYVPIGRRIVFEAKKAEPS
jgi:hypothetical protein